MLRVISCIVFVFFLFSCSSEYENVVKHASSKIKVDGIGSDDGWSTVEWRSIDQKWLGPDYSKEDFSGRYKLTWDKNNIYVLAEIVDDKLIDIHEDGLVKYWDDDCFEVFIDQDASGGDHQYNYNAFAYHIALDNKVVDIGIDSMPHYYDHVNTVRKTKGNTSVWELSMDVYDDTFVRGKTNKKTTLQDKQEIGFAIAYCDNDNSEERENFIGSTVVEGEDKNRGWIDAGIFEKFVLVK